MRQLSFTSELAADRATVWAHATTLDGVNEELAPLHMSGPRGVRLDASVPTGRPLFRSLVTVLRVLPLDLHELTLARVDEGRGFHEASRSLLQARWVHVRTLADLPEGGTRVTDELEFEPRLFAPLVERIVRAVFERRHAALRRKFGRAGA
jgi:hypothetical protein